MMRFTFLRFVHRPAQKGISWLLLAACLVAGGIALLSTADRVEAPAARGSSSILFCPFKSLTGYPCPFCGVTRGTGWMLRGDFDKAWRFNILSPASALVLTAGAFYLLVFRIVRRRALRLQLSEGARRAMWISASAAVLLAWTVNLLRASEAGSVLFFLR